VTDAGLKRRFECRELRARVGGGVLRKSDRRIAGRQRQVRDVSGRAPTDSQPMYQDILPCDGRERRGPSGDRSQDRTRESTRRDPASSRCRRTARMRRTNRIASRNDPEEAAAAAATEAEEAATRADVDVTTDIRHGVPLRTDRRLRGDESGRYDYRWDGRQIRARSPHLGQRRRGNRPERAGPGPHGSRQS